MSLFYFIHLRRKILKRIVRQHHNNILASCLRAFRYLRSRIDCCACRLSKEETIRPRYLSSRRICLFRNYLDDLIIRKFLLIKIGWKTLFCTVKH